ncbi:hypothetical protein ABIE85_002151 [Bradyrhizobium diazoefficiens]|uniref:hypothetical protein n=1 Tax=Bradyrhizobium diazoefficiens TaxID=1355477 RepID=UPI00272AACB4|nr:hypothetical protein [Bradyrhizobium diazoefficiens]WLA60920.1 hypothetical protein QIH81_20320 [Bradyrhizobium diazoefficiens]
MVTYLEAKLKSGKIYRRFARAAVSSAPRHGEGSRAIHGDGRAHETNAQLASEAIQARETLHHSLSAPTIQIRT